jgi:hypothetical protein
VFESWTGPASCGQRRGRVSRGRVKNACVSLAKYSVQFGHIGGLVGWHVMPPAFTLVHRLWKSARIVSWRRRIVEHSGHGSSCNVLCQFPRFPQSGHHFRRRVFCTRATGGSVHGKPGHGPVVASERSRERYPWKRRSVSSLEKYSTLPVASLTITAFALSTGSCVTGSSAVRAVCRFSSVSLHAGQQP